MKQTDIEERVRQLTWPVPSRGLRDRVVSAGAVVPRQSITWSDRMWFSRAWRLSAVAVTAVFVALEYLSGPPRVAGAPAPPHVLAEARAVDDIVRQLGLSADVAASLARRALFETAHPSPADEGRTALREFVTEGEPR